MEPLSGLITLIAAILVFVTAILEYNRHTLNKNISEMQKKIESMKLFISNVYYDLFEDTDVIFLGPRFQGKSSLVTTIARQWKSIQGMRATTSFEIFTWESPEFVSQKNLNSDFGVDMENRTRARLNIYDYAGDDDMIFTALEQMSNSKNYIIVFVLSSIAESTPSSKYFNITTVKKIKQYLSNSTSECLAPYIVFNKQDLMDQAPQDPVSFAIDLMSHHRGAIENIESFFGDTTNILVSAETGFGVATFTRRLLSHIVDSNGKPIR